MQSLPKDPMILYSYVNTKLRDDYADLDALCEDMDVDKNQLLSTLGGIGLEYSVENNKFW